MKFKILVMCVVISALIEDCKGNNVKDVLDNNHEKDNGEFDNKNRKEHDDLKTVTASRKINKSVLKPDDSNIEDESPKLNLRLNSDRPGQYLKRPISKLQQEIQILQPKKLEKRPKIKSVIIPVLQTKKKSAKKKPTKDDKLIQNIQVKTNGEDNSKESKKVNGNKDDQLDHQNETIHDHHEEDHHIINNAVGNHKTTEVQKSASIPTKLKETDAKKAINLEITFLNDLEPAKSPMEKVEPPQKVVTVKSSKTPDADKKSIEKEIIKNIANIFAVNNTLADNEHSVDEEHIVSDMTQTEDVEGIPETFTSSNTTNEEKTDNSSKITESKVIDMKLVPNQKENQTHNQIDDAKFNIDLLRQNEEVNILKNQLIESLNLLSDPIDKMAVNNEVIEEISEKPNNVNQNPNFGQTGRNTINQYTYPYYATYYNVDHMFKWQAPNRISTFNSIPNYNYNQQSYWPSYGYPNYGYGNNQNYKPDNTYTPSPYKYPVELLKTDIESRNRLWNQNNYNYNKKATPNSFSPNYNWYHNPYQKQAGGNKISNPLSSYNYNEIKMNGKNLERIWRRWHKTQVILSNDKGEKSYQMVPKRLGRVFA